MTKISALDVQVLKKTSKVETVSYKIILLMIQYLR